MKKTNLIYTIIFGIISVAAHSYPQFASFGYRSCLTCHYNPMGNGPLNDYGRAVSATAVSGRDLVSSSVTEETIASNSNFFFGKLKKNYWLRPSIDYRGIFIQSDVNKDTSSERFIHMQAAVSVVAKSKRDDLFVSADIGYAPTSPFSDEPNVRSREHYVGWKPSRNHGVYFGLMDIAFGIRLADHTAYSRRYNGLAQNDQTHGVMYHLITKKYEMGLHGFTGNLSQDKELRQVGGSLYSEFSLTPNWHLGGSLLSSSSDYKDQFLYAGHSRIRFGKGSVLLTEFGIKSEKFVAQSTPVDSLYGMIRTQTLLRRGVFVNSIFDYYKSDTAATLEMFRLGMGLQYFPAQRLEFRMDAYTTRSYNSLSQSGTARLYSDSFNLLSQVHLWL